jgi:hydrogenase expression/formation protein HypD
MEFCGGHTVAILKYGIRQLLPNTIHMFSGPGCPVCVTSSGDIDNIIMLSRQPGVILTTFGDLMRVPGNGFSLHNREQKETTSGLFILHWKPWILQGSALNAR